MKTLIAYIRGFLILFAILDLLAWLAVWFGGHGNTSSEEDWAFGLLFLFFMGSSLILGYQKARREDREREEKNS
jgi:peptidoglycan/LPS O-acetylase OafA/YrhL